MTLNHEIASDVPLDAWLLLTKGAHTRWFIATFKFQNYTVNTFTAEGNN